MSTDDEQLTSADIFGDVLAEVEAEDPSAGTSPAARKRPSLPMKDIERRLEETLSGVIPTVGKSKRPSVARAPEQREKTRRRRPELPTDTEIDELLDQTLSSLDLPTRPRKAAAAPHRTADDPPAAEAAGAAPQPGGPAPEPASRKAPEAPAVRPEPESPPTASEVEPAGAIPATPEGGAAESAPDETAAAEGVGAAAGEPSFAPPASPFGARSTILDELPAEASQFRTQALPTFDLSDDLGGEASGDVADGETFGDYTLLDRIAVGGMAEVWRARRRGVEGFQKTVAIKKILSHLTGSKDFVTMFIDEAKLAAQLSHNNIIQIYDLGKVGDDYFIAMEHVDGKDLRSILTAAQESGRPIPPGLGLLIVSAVASALHYAHRKRDFDHRAMGLVHRDVSPQNVLISYEGAIKLCDFGIVKAVAKASTTQMGALKGKLQYMSPEQAWGKSVDARSDIFSLGSVFYEVLTGTQLFSGESEIGVLDAVRECQISSPREIEPGISEEVARVVLKALSKSPDERYQTAGDLEHDIRDALDNLRPTPSQKDLAVYLRSLFEAQKSGPVALAANAAAGAGKPPATAGGPPADSAVGPPASDEPPSVDPPAAAPAAIESLTEPPAAEPPAAEGTAAEPPESVDKSAPGTGRWKWIAAAVLAAALIAAGFLVLPSLSKREAPTAPAAAPSAERTPEPAPPTVSPAPLEDPAAAAAGDPTGADTAGGVETASGAETAEATQDSVASGTAGEEPVEPDDAVTAAGVDIEQLVNEELSNRAEQLRRDFEAEKKRIEEELARTQAQSREPAPSDEEEDDGGGGGDGR